ncbi:hypothetical protein WA026_000962 [Henosepilachna vigintioctopunctata]|uniref:Nucleolar protein 16 n=1 Tax=Henosepilachna vigintioctopunctata TaxID=420089 RepID=A0AAW1V945_9CUCU
MTKLRKQRRKKKFRYNVNRKRLRNKIHGVGNIKCKEISNEWENHKSVETNLKEMGLSYDPNKTIKIEKRVKRKVKPDVSNKNNSEWMEVVEEIPQEISATKKTVAEKLLVDSKLPREKMLRLPGSQVEWLSYLLDTYGKDYKAMSKDKSNYKQETWKKIRQQIKLFKSVPEQYQVYLDKRGISADVEDDTSSDGEL